MQLHNDFFHHYIKSNIWKRTTRRKEGKFLLPPKNIFGRLGENDRRGGDKKKPEAICDDDDDAISASEGPKMALLLRTAAATLLKKRSDGRRSRRKLQTERYTQRRDARC